MKISVIMPVYNEVKTIKEIIKRVKNTNIVDEIIVVDDFSIDGTRQVLETIDGIKVYYHEKNQGKGAAIHTGLGHVTKDIIIIQDADLEYDPQDYIKLINPIQSGITDVVYGSRFLKREPHFSYKKFFYFTHFIGNKFLNFMLNILYKTHITDMETCYKAIKIEALKDLSLSAKGFNIEPEITVKLLRQGLKIYEVPITYAPRDYKDGKKISWRDGMAAMCILWKYRL